VTVTETPEQFIAAVERAAVTTIDPAALDTFLDAQTWDARAAQLLQSLAVRAPATAEDPTIHASFAHPTTSDIMRYATALEHELEAVQTWARQLEQQATASSVLQRLQRLVASR